MKTSRIIFIIGTVLLFPALYTAITIFIWMLSFEYIDLFNIINFDKIFDRSGGDTLFFGITLWGFILWAISIIKCLNEMGDAP